MSEVRACIGAGGDRILGILIVAFPGDDVDSMNQVYCLATEARVLVTTIVFANRSTPLLCAQGLGFMESLRRESDVLVQTPDESYLEYAVDCLIGPSP